jgi:hypothetical protein
VEANGRLFVEVPLLEPALPASLAAGQTFEATLEITYVIRVLVDRRFRPDTAIERPVAVA